MTVGEKIQYYRKKLNMSQEELGQKICVSRQAISLWEKGQTVPTIDNLVQLKGVFDVSIDEMLSMSEDNAGEKEPAEVYSFAYTEDDYRTITGQLGMIHFKKPVIYAIVLLVFIILIAISNGVEKEGPIAVLSGMLFAYGIGLIKNIRSYIKNNKALEEKIRQSNYRYEIYDGYLEYIISRGGEADLWAKCEFSDIRMIQYLDDYILLFVSTGYIVIRRSDLNVNSRLYAFLYNNPGKISRKTVPDKWRVTSIALFIASLLSIYGAMASETALSIRNGLFEENMWVFFLWIPIPIASLLFGLTAKAKGKEKYKKNIVVGIIMTILLFVYGCFVFIFKDAAV